MLYIISLSIAVGRMRITDHCFTVYYTNLARSLFFHIWQWSYITGHCYSVIWHTSANNQPLLFCFETHNLAVHVTHISRARSLFPCMVAVMRITDHCYVVCNTNKHTSAGNSFTDNWLLACCIWATSAAKQIIVLF